MIDPLHTIVHGGTREQLCEGICRALVETGGYSMAWIAWCDEHLRVIPSAVYGDESGYVRSLSLSAKDIPEGRGPVGIAIREKRTVLVSDALADSSMSLWREQRSRTPWRSSVVVPLNPRLSAAGVLVVNNEQAGGFDGTDAEKLTALGNDLAILVDNLEATSAAQRAEKTLRESEQRFRRIIEESPTAFFICDQYGRYTDVNAAACSLTGYSRAELLERTIADLVPEEWHKRAFGLFGQVVETGHAEGDTAFILRNGETGFWHISSIKLAENEFFAFVTDISKHIQLEETLRNAQQRAEQASAAKSSFLANMSHEIRTPLNAIIGFAELLNVRATDETQVARNEEYVQQIISAGRTLNGLLGSILDLSKIESGKLDATYSVFNAAKVFENLCQIFSLKAQSLGIKFQYMITPGEDTFIRCDEQFFSQILTNLLDNAMKFTPAGANVMAQLSIDGRLMNLTICDEGIGIAPEKLETVFSPFTQADASITRKFGGTGLGLTICRSLVKILGGTISIRPNNTKGSLFEVRLPIEIATGSEKPRPAGEKQPRPGANILVIEDNEVNQILMSEFLQSLGMRTTLAENGQTGYEIARTLLPDLIIMDIHMPVMSGIACAALLRSTEVTKKIPIIGLSADAFSERRSEALDSGFTEYLIKPVNFQDLTGILAKLLE